MPKDFATCLTHLNDAIRAENGPNLAYLLRPTSPQGKKLVKSLRSPTYKGSVASPWDDVAIQYVLVCTHIAHGRSFMRFFVENKGWTLHALFSILRDLRDLADDADGPMGEDSKMEAARTVAKTFSACLMDRTSPIEESRKWGVYYVVGLVMKCYFKVKKIALTKNILKALNNNNEIPALEDYPQAHQVTYRYYIGMLAFLDEDFAKAEKELTLAFYNCTVRSPNNQTRILAYLIPLRILRGHLPSKALLKRFPILDDLFSPFISAIRSGHLAAFDDARSGPSEVRRLQNALEEKRKHRLESSESILMDARKRIEALNRTVGEPPDDQPELTSMLKTLVDDNDTLRRDNALLADSREDYRALQDETEAATPAHLKQHFHTGSVPSAMLSPSYSFKHSSSNGRRSSRHYEPLTPETNRQPLSPTDSLANSDTKWSAFNAGRLPGSPSQTYFGDADDVPEERRQHKSLLLLSRSRGVQTDPMIVPPTPAPYPASASPSSNTSAYSEPLSAALASLNPPSNLSMSIGAIVERTTMLLQRLQTANAFSLTNRLKRQQIRGADVGHLSRTTVAGIISDVKKQLQGVPEEEELRTHRRDVRAPLNVLREMFGARGEMRVEAVMDPAKAHGAEEAQSNGPMGWISAPLSKLFAGTPTAKVAEVDRAATTSPLAAPRPMAPRFVPKLGPALAASATTSATTVNVEFSGAGMGRAMTSTFDAGPGRSTPAQVQPAASSSSSGVMGIFAGVPRTNTPDPWVVIPHPKSPVPRTMPPSLLNRPGLRQHPNRMSRNVDAMLDGVGTPTRPVAENGEEADEEPDYVGPLLNRTLRRRGPSDSSIQSTFTSQAAEGDDADDTRTKNAAAPWLESGSVLQALSRRVQSFRSGLSGNRIVAAPPVERSRTSGTASLSGSEPGMSPPKPTAPIAVGISRRSPSHSGFNTFLANLVPNAEASEMARSIRDCAGMPHPDIRVGHWRGRRISSLNSSRTMLQATQITQSPGTQPEPTTSATSTGTVDVETRHEFETSPYVAQRRLLLSTQPGLFTLLLPPEEREALATPMHCILPATEGDGLGALCLGSAAAALDIVPLEEKRIRHLVQVIEPPQPVPSENPREWPLEYFRIEIKDTPKAAKVLAEKLPAVCDYIAEALGRGESVLVHCEQGISRSASVVIAFHIRERAMS
ncbi:PCI domain-containing protein [Mycena chlorophos]|uniref:PCI domain-containing protein n=1 Tax=Mycena chlorophos TaxID=658473 RepID=A0A8H6VW51_MYCCL|nr:PCI domain-containing protein [Mycena chlorophos]